LKWYITFIIVGTRKERNMRTTRLDYSIFEKFDFERQPVGIKYSLIRPKGIEPLDRKLAICEMFKEAQTSQPFYATAENIQCGEHIVGFELFPPGMYSGQVGPKFFMFRNPAANRRVYDYIPVLPKDSVKYITHAPLDKMQFDPDLLIITANTRQAEIIMRASSYSDGRMWTMKGSTCLSCAWLYSYPYLSGELNFCITGLGFSMKAREVLPEGLFLISVPCNLLLGLIDNLNDMEWDPYWFHLGGSEGFIKGTEELRKVFEKEYADE
jgi:uncharacterized protein (DUF169 family)